MLISKFIPLKSIQNLFFMKSIAFFIITIFLYSNILTSQIVQDDFEGNGNISTWFGDDCGMNINFGNPFPQGNNTSATVLRYDDVGGQYANVRFDGISNFPMSTDNVFSLKIYVPSSGITGASPNQISLKLQDGNLGAPWSTQSEIIKPIVLNQWQTVSFDFANDSYINLDGGSFPPTQRTDFNRVVIQVNGENNNDRVLAYLDDFSYGGTNTTNPGTDPDFNTLVWADEFDGTGAIDGSKWFHQTQLPLADSWYNGEIQHYTNRVENSYVSNGTMKIRARKESFTDQGVNKQYTSARLNSKFAFKYGRVEIRAKLPTGVGTWPAMWMLGKNIDENGAYWDNQGYDTTPWPACGEIDIMEHWGSNQNYVQSAMHTPSSFGNTSDKGGRVVPTVSSAFHIYTLDWTPEKMVFKIDGIEHYTYEPTVRNANTWPFDAEQYILLNVAIQGSIAPSFTESSMEIDYVRVYQEGSPTSVGQVGNTSFSYYPNPVDDTLMIELDESVQQEIRLNIHNIKGQLVHSFRENVSGNQFLVKHLGHLPKGVYVVSFSMDNEMKAFKVMKQ